MTAVRCTNCDAEIAPNAKFCTTCGTPTAAPAPRAAVAAPMEGASMSDSSAYTNQPGQRLDLPNPSVTMRGQGTTGMEYQLIGTTMQAWIMELDPGETVYSESGGMAWMSGNINMQTSGRGGGLGGIFKRRSAGGLSVRVD